MWPYKEQIISIFKGVFKTEKGINSHHVFDHLYRYLLYLQSKTGNELGDRKFHIVHMFRIK
jgi:hypothetical protein